MILLGFLLECSIKYFFHKSMNYVMSLHEITPTRSPLVHRRYAYHPNMLFPERRVGVSCRERERESHIGLWRVWFQIYRLHIIIFQCWIKIEQVFVKVLQLPLSLNKCCRFRIQYHVTFIHRLPQVLCFFYPSLTEPSYFFILTELWLMLYYEGIQGCFNHHRTWGKLGFLKS